MKGQLKKNKKLSAIIITDEVLWIFKWNTLMSTGSNLAYPQCQMIIIILEQLDEFEIKKH